MFASSGSLDFVQLRYFIRLSELLSVYMFYTLTSDNNLNCVLKVTWFFIVFLRCLPHCKLIRAEYWQFFTSFVRWSDCIYILAIWLIMHKILFIFLSQLCKYMILSCFEIAAITSVSLALLHYNPNSCRVEHHVNSYLLFTGIPFHFLPTNCQMPNSGEIMTRLIIKLKWLCNWYGLNVSLINSLVS